jgi:ABC-type antimicrobial peptide transport system permease subunit
MLIDSKAKDRESVAEFLSFYFKDFGIEFTPAAQRLAEFNSVTNTYLNVFMMLGGLGVAIGTLGFGIVLLRNKLERKKELALFMAVGITNQQLFKLVFFEHFIVLAIGLGIGILSALVGFLPSLISPAFNFPGIFVFVWVLIIFLSGLISIAITAKVSNNNQLVDTLRNEIDYA